MFEIQFEYLERKKIYKSTSEPSEMAQNLTGKLPNKSSNEKSDGKLKVAWKDVIESLLKVLTEKSYLIKNCRYNLNYTNIFFIC